MFPLLAAASKTIMFSLALTHNACHKHDGVRVLAEGIKRLLKSITLTLTLTFSNSYKYVTNKEKALERHHENIPV